MDISMLKMEYRNMATIMMRVKTTSVSRESKGAQDMSMMGANKSDMIKMVLEEAAGLGDDAAGGGEVVFQEGFGGGHYWGVLLEVV
jgi:3-oxoacyl-[acyl-carrier-protein] synthase III